MAVYSCLYCKRRYGPEKAGQACCGALPVQPVDDTTFLTMFGTAPLAIAAALVVICAFGGFVLYNVYIGGPRGEKARSAAFDGIGSPPGFDRVEKLDSSGWTGGTWRKQCPAGGTCQADTVREVHAWLNGLGPGDTTPEAFRADCWPADTGFKNCWSTWTRGKYEVGWFESDVSVAGGTRTITVKLRLTDLDG